MMLFCGKIVIDGDNMYEILKLVYILMVVIWYIIFIVFLLVIYFSNAKPHKSKYKGEKNESCPSNFKPAELSMLLYKKIITEVFTASILFLIYNNDINVKKEKYDYIFSLNKKNNQKLNKNQKYIIDILFESIGKGDSLRLSKLETYLNNEVNASEFYTNYYVWKRMAQSETFHTHYYEPKANYELIVIYKYIAVLLVTINFIASYHMLTVYLLIILSIILKFFFYKTYKRTKESNDEYHKWKSFKNYLLTFSNEEVELSDEQTLKYLMSGSILRVSKNMKNEIFDGMDELVIKLNEIISKCVTAASLPIHRKIEWR